MSGASGRLGLRALNRATLARQGLLERSARPVGEVLEHLVGLQAQAPEPPYYGLWSRIAGFVPGDLASMIEDGSAVRIALMRSTIHLVTARDCASLRPVVQPVLDAQLRGSYGRQLEGLDVDALAAEGRRLMEEEPRAWSDLGARLAKRFGREPQALANAVRAWVPLVQVPPRAVWGRGGPAVHRPADTWLGRSFEPDAGPAGVEALVLRYLAAFGPATVADARKWSGLTGLGDVFERLRPRLTTLVDEAGRELFDLPDAPRPDPDVPAPPRFVAEFDNLLLSHADRTRVLPDEYAPSVLRGGMIAGTVLLDGFVAGAWKVDRRRRSASLRITSFRRLRKAERRGVEAEGDRLLAFAAQEARAREIAWAGP